MTLSLPQGAPHPFIQLPHSINKLFMKLPLSARLFSQLQGHYPSPHGVYSLTGHPGRLTGDSSVRKAQTLEKSSEAETGRCEDSCTAWAVCAQGRRETGLEGSFQSDLWAGLARLWDLSGHRKRAVE